LIAGDVKFIADALDAHLQETAENGNPHGINDKANKVQENWITPTLTNGWETYSSNYTPVGYMKDEFGFVHLRGAIKNGTIGGWIFMLPAEYRPSKHVRFPAASLKSANEVSPRIVEVLSYGYVYLFFGSNFFFSFDGIFFKAGD